MTTTTGLRRTPQQTRSQRTLDAILDATIELLIEGHRLEDLTMSTIATRASISKAAIYRYYPDRPTIIRAVADSYAGPLTDQIHEAWRAGGVDEAVAAYRRAILDGPALREIWITGYSYAELGRWIADFEQQAANRLANDPSGAGCQVSYWRTWLRNARAAVELELLDNTAQDPER